MWIVRVVFEILCDKCGYKNRPSRNTKKSIEMALLGEFKKCRGCGLEFQEIVIPERKAVKKILESLGREKVHPMITLVDCHDGRYDQASGIAAQLAEP